MQKPADNKRPPRRHEEKSEFEQYILDLARVTRVTEGGKHMSFRVCIILGDRHGRVGYGVAKGADVQLGVEKAVHQAKKRMITVPIIKDTIPPPVVRKFKAAQVMLKPAPKGSGIIAGGGVRSVLDLAGIPNVSSKILGKTKNKIAIVKATFDALKSFKKPMHHKKVEEKKA
jgi:small subunit ribosomal protein S5